MKIIYFELKKKLFFIIVYKIHILNMNNSLFTQYANKQYELINFMRNNGFNITIFGAPQSFISKVSKRDPNINHNNAYDKLSFVEDYLKNNLEEAKKEYDEIEKELEEIHKSKSDNPMTYKF